MIPSFHLSNYCLMLVQWLWSDANVFITAWYSKRSAQWQIWMFNDYPVFCLHSMDKTLIAHHSKYITKGHPGSCLLPNQYIIHMIQCQGLTGRHQMECRQQTVRHSTNLLSKKYKINTGTFNNIYTEITQQYLSNLPKWKERSCWFKWDWVERSTSKF